jgi:hypothetical protein
MKAETPFDFEYTAQSVDEITTTLRNLGATKAILKILPKNANDKNQIYFSSDFGVLYNNFELRLAERGISTSTTKTTSSPGSYIPEAVFAQFAWAKPSGTVVRAKNVKAIVYTQYPEARLSGFLTVENTMPESLSVTFTKANPTTKRLLVLACTPGGGCIGLVYIGMPPGLEREIAALPGVEGSKVCKLLTVDQNYSERLFNQLAQLVSRPIKGCRLNSSGATIPFTGTQVCGYTLEHALGLSSNSAKDGDIYGIELKTHTQPKVTLFTPEPDFGPYVTSFEAFMRRYGYETSAGEWRLTGVHRAGKRCASSKLTLKVREYRMDPATVGPGRKTDWIRDANGERIAFPYEASTSLTAKLDAVEVVLEDDDGNVAAGWSLERLMNNWGVKHNEAVYISASKVATTDKAAIEEGYGFNVTFSPRVIWCRGTSAERLLSAIDSGVIFLDPAPKFVEGDTGKNKRRSQWRVNDVNGAIEALYDRVEVRTLSPFPPAERAPTWREHSAGVQRQLEIPVRFAG